MRALRSFTLLIHGAAALIAAYVASRNGWALTLLPLLLGAFWWSCLRSLRQQRAEFPKRIIRLVLQPGGHWRWYRHNGVQGEASHAPSSVRLPWLIILHLRPVGGGALITLLLPPDALPADQHRRLRMRLLKPSPELSV